MENLALCQVAAAQLDLPLADGEQVARVALNTAEGLIYFATTHGSVICVSSGEGKVQRRELWLCSMA
jgi:hypothetical protein